MTERDALAEVIAAAARWRWQLAAAGHRDQAARLDRALHAVVHDARQPAPGPAPYETTAQVAARLGVDPSTVRRRAATGQLDAVKRGTVWLIRSDAS